MGDEKGADDFEACLGAWEEDDGEGEEGFGEHHCDLKWLCGLSSFVL